MHIPLLKQNRTETVHIRVEQRDSTSIRDSMHFCLSWTCRLHVSTPMPAGQANVNLADIHLSLFAQHSTNKVKRALRGDNIEAPVSGAQKRKFANVMRAPRACFEGISVKATSGQPVTFYACNIGKILEYTASHIPTFRNKIYSLEREDTQNYTDNGWIYIGKCSAGGFHLEDGSLVFLYLQLQWNAPSIGVVTASCYSVQRFAICRGRHVCSGSCLAPVHRSTKHWRRHLGPTSMPQVSNLEFGSWLWCLADGLQLKRCCSIETLYAMQKHLWKLDVITGNRSIFPLHRLRRLP